MKHLLFFLITFSLSIPSDAQSLPSKLVTALDSLENNYPLEKAFLHTDRTAYTSEESIWFKAYITLDGRPSFLSKVAYVELVNANNEVIEKRMLPTNTGSINGDIYLKKDIPSGVYSLNAYTLWMLNFPNYIFKKPVYIYNTDFKEPAHTKDEFDYKVGFFPESGNLIEGLKNNVSFKAIDNNDQPINISGEILDSKGQRVATLTTSHEGMGTFELTPISNETYSAVFLEGNIKKKTVALPKAQKEGINLQINNANTSRLFFQLHRSEQNKTAYNELTLVGRMNNTVVYLGNINFDEGTSAGAISTKNLPTGILQLTVFDSKGAPLAERLSFVNNNLPLNSLLQTDSFSTDKRKKNVFKINLSEFKNPSASISISNYAADSSTHDDNIFSSLLLTSELKGHITNPAYYLKDKEPETLKHLDLLLTTHGWRRFNWDQILRYQLPSIQYPVESDLTVRGKITRANGKTIVPNSRIDFITKTEDSTTILSTVTLTSNDQFVLSGLDFKKRASIYYQGTNTKKENAFVKISLYPSYFDTLRNSINSFKTFNRSQSYNKFAFTSFYQKALDMKKAIEKAEGLTLSEVTVKSKKLSAVDSISKLYVSDIFRNSDRTIVAQKLNFSTVWQFVQFHIAGITVGRNENGETTVYSTRGLNMNLNAEEAISTDPTTNLDFYLNEVKVSKDIVELIDPNDLVLVKVWKESPAYVIGSERPSIAFYTEKEKVNKLWGQRGFDVYKKEGYSISREFYSLDYSKISQDSPFKDYRPTLYWNPNLKAEANGSSIIQFYNDDETKKFKVTIQGIDENGKIINIQKILQ